jgi:protoporphyrinogen oxidase
MAAIGADHRFRQHGFSPILYDQASEPGGHTTTHIFEGGWSFDEGPHVSFTKEQRIKDLLSEAVGGDFQSLAANVDNYWRGYRFKHPAICNLYGLPADLVVGCLEDFVKASGELGREPDNYEDWLVAAYGRTFAETFPMEYAKKVHTTSADQLATDWLGPRLYRPELAEVLRGAVSNETPNVHYVTEYRYPSHGGFFSYLRPFLERADVRSNHRVSEVDSKERRVRFIDGSETSYDHLVSSVPLPDFVPMIAGVPGEVLEAAGRLAATSMVLVNIGIDREDVGDTWTYFYDQDVIFTRMSYPSRLSPNMAPPGCGSFQAEIYFSAKYSPVAGAPEDYIERTITDMRRTALLEHDDQILHKSAMWVPYANIIHDHDKLPALRLIHGYLEEIGINMSGRYGLWGYQWTDEAFASGEEAAQRVIDSI